jgi:4a-hydroxytetrahydrobiopterin dehydratase
MKIKALEASEIADSLNLIPSWKIEKINLDSPDSLQRNFTFIDFKTALEFTNIVGDLSDTLNHHPDILLSWGKLNISIHTHSINGISELDVELARRIDNSFKKFSELKN